MDKLNPLQKYTGYRWDNLNKYAMEKDKYYVPTIDEFFDGFEYEFYKAGTDYEYIKMKFSFSIDNLSDLSRPIISDIYKSVLQDAWLRIKYIDKEDIESLGWRPIKPFSNECLTFIRIVKSIPYMNKDVYLDYYPATHSININNNEKYEDHVCWFNGKIKNKSELIKLLKQLDFD